jgi:hypothetical protein
MEGVLQDRGTFRGIARTLLALAMLAERSAARSFPVRFLVLAILFRAEAIARRFVAREIEADWPDSPCLEDPGAKHYGPADAQLLALRLRMLAVVLGALADAADGSDECLAGLPAGHPPYADLAPHLPVILIFRLPAGQVRRPSRPP